MFRISAKPKVIECNNVAMLNRGVGLEGRGGGGGEGRGGEGRGGEGRGGESGESKV